ncbi:hypothetical protein SNE40_008162 [Patella caerulea]|uniref:SLC12A transporter C-terminal domain-containing protein n=1 Tax=Patella caerulea TaxID=87958 RepID=A0AAN8JZ78_PATCE
MLLLLAFLLQQNPTWKHCTLRIFTIAQLEDNSVQLKRDIEKYLYHLRIKASVTVVELIDSDISAYIYERTLQMEERSKLIQNMRLKKHASRNQLQDIVDNAHSQRDFMTIEKLEPLEDVLEETEPVPVIGALSAVDVPSSERIQYTYSSITQLRRETYYKQPQRKPDKKNVRKMHTAIELNKHIASLSKEAEIVIVNMPSFPTTPCNNENCILF